jgi:hypothetical protein
VGLGGPDFVGVAVVVLSRVDARAAGRDNSARRVPVPALAMSE